MPSVPGVVGVGIDLVDIPTFTAQVDVPGTVFLANFSGREIRHARHRASQTGHHFAHHLAARWAAKEAFVKAWSQALYGSPPPFESVDFAGIHIEADAWGRQQVVLAPDLADALSDVADSVHLSLTHDGDNAIAVVVLSATTRR